MRPLGRTLAILRQKRLDGRAALHCSRRSFEAALEGALGIVRSDPRAVGGGDCGDIDQALHSAAVEDLRLNDIDSARVKQVAERESVGKALAG